jgi:hypothetical protein
MTPGELYGTLEVAAIFTRLLGDALKRLNWSATESGEYREQEWHYAVQSFRDASRYMQGRETRTYGSRTYS